MQSRAFVPSIPLQKSTSKSVTSSSSTSNPSPLSVSTTSRQRRSRSSALSSHLSTPTGSSLPSTLQTNPSPAASSNTTTPTIQDDNSNTNRSAQPSPAEWLRANEASLKTPRDVLRIGIPSHQQHEHNNGNSRFASSKPINIPKRSPKSTSRIMFNNNNNEKINLTNYNYNLNNTNNAKKSSNNSPTSSSPSSIQLSSSPSSLARTSLPSAIPKVSSTHMITSTPPSYCPVGFDIKYAGNELDNRIFYLGPVARNKVIKAVEIAKLSDIPSHILAENITVALVVADLQMDCDTVCAAILRTIIDLKNFNEKVTEQQVGIDVIKILKHHKQLEESVNLCVDPSFTEMSFSNLRELILVRAVEEHRSILLELARAVLAIRTIDTLPNDELKKSVARRTMYLYAPLANQLGIWYVQSELEELAFMYLDSKSFELIRHLVGERRRECEDMLKESKQFLERILSQTVEIRNLIRTVHIKGRVKGLYSVYRKMKKSCKKVYEIYDLLALRVVVQPKKADDQAEIDACYAVQNVINQYYETFESRAKDYIEQPKRNGYRSLHMTVLPHGGSTPLEIQIRTEKMHHVAEFGAAAHWIYKEEDQEEYDDDELEVEVNIKNKNNDNNSFSEFELDSDVESIWSDSDSESDSEGGDNFMFFNFEEENKKVISNRNKFNCCDNNEKRVLETTTAETVNINTNLLKNVKLNDEFNKIDEKTNDEEDDNDNDNSNNNNNNNINNNNDLTNNKYSSSSPSSSSTSLTTVSPSKLKLSLTGRMISDKEINFLRRNAKHSVISTKNITRKREAVVAGNKRKIRVSKSTKSHYPRPRVPINNNITKENKLAQQQMDALESKRQSMRRNRIEDNDELQYELRSGYVSCLASAIRASRVIVSTAGQLYGLAVGSTLMDLASSLGVATLGAIAVVNGQIVPLSQRLNMNDIVQFINL